jgi:hypothetical protein
VNLGPGWDQPPYLGILGVVELDGVQIFFLVGVQVVVPVNHVYRA